ncbi:MAG: hypothetical protein GAK35_03941 [Herbaspirillum frisingense]|uniref:Uncharacterized protein n=1 Tax=Herbaspirillum frisingense TaxID=92645 RepID=A0A7V8FTC5_9BURK|nr:MAG: hypothetical protein GAK35_03941 [Herbaspirillum frisingense]
MHPARPYMLCLYGRRFGTSFHAALPGMPITPIETPMKKFSTMLCTAPFGLAASATAHAEGAAFDYSNVTSTHVTKFVRGTEAVDITRLKLTTPKDAKILFQFSSAITAESSEGCPCSVRAMVAMDGQEPRIVKRINVGSPEVASALHYQWDRQALDGTTVFEAGPGEHTFTLIFKQASGSSKQLEVNYPNAQVFILGN